MLLLTYSPAIVFLLILMLLYLWYRFTEFKDMLIKSNIAKETKPMLLKNAKFKWFEI